MAVPALEVGPVAGAGSFTAGGSVNQVYVTGLTPGAEVELLSASSMLVDDGVADSAGAHLFREVAAGTGFKVRSEGTTISGLEVTTPTDHPDDDWYVDQVAADPLESGFGYITTRDGTKLSVNVTYPIGAGTGPWPVVVNYSGYDPSKPGPPPSESLLYAAQGYAVVGVNMRGTGCSGGAFEFMETLQSTDGYDMVETLARQPWANGNVGLVGISYSGYSQLYVAATQPPHLRAITPLSPYSDTYSAILYPGGILNNGFAVEWATDRQNGAKPRATAWARKRIDEGDDVCKRNQDLRLQSKPLLERIHETPFAEHEFDYLNTETFVDQIQVPTYLASQWQDEQTGGSAANLVPLFDPDTDVFASFTNGAHVEPMAPSEIVYAMAFIDIYVGQRVPSMSGFIPVVAPAELAKIFGSSDPAQFMLPPVPFADEPTWDAAKAAWEAQPRVRIKWDNGANPGQEGLPIGRAETRHQSWPIPGLVNEALYLQPDSVLAETAATVPDESGRASTAYEYDRTSKRPKTMTGSREAAWAPHPDYKWDPLAEDHSLSYLTSPYDTDVAYAGQGSVDLWLRSTEADTDIEVTLTEVRPDGHEVFIQSGWLRASHRKLDDALSTELVPFHTHQAADAAPLAPGEFTPVRVEMFPFAHVIRAGSQLRLNIEVPGGNQPFWAFEALSGTPVNEIGHSLGMPSRVVLPRVPDAQAPAVPAALPACSLPDVTTQAVSLRNQPCRPYLPARRPTAVTATPVEDEATVIVTWEPPPGAALPTSYKVVPVRMAGEPGEAEPEPITVSGDEHTTQFILPENVFFEFRVIALYGDQGDEGPPSDASLPVLILAEETPPPTTVAQPPVTRPEVVTTTTADPATTTTGPETGGSGTTSTTGSSTTTTALGSVTSTTLATVTSTTIAATGSTTTTTAPVPTSPATPARPVPGSGAAPAGAARPIAGRPVYTG